MPFFSVGAQTRVVVSASRRCACAALALACFFPALPRRAVAAESDPAATSTPDRATILATLYRAADFMIGKAGPRGNFVWSYLPDLSRRWGEMEAFPTMLWMQSPGSTEDVGQVFLDAYHVTKDEFYYQSAAKIADALVSVQHPSGGWNYIADLAGEDSLKKWYATIGRNGWRLEEFQHYYGNATYDDVTTISVARFILRIYLEKHDARYKASLDHVIQFVLDSQYPVGGWPQRFPPARETFSKDGLPDYTGFITLNDDVASENIDFLIQCYGALGEKRLLEAARRGMDSFIKLQQPAPQAGWALQYTTDLQPAGARTYEPKALVTHTTASCIEQLLKFYALTGDTKYLAPIPAALDWLDSVKLPPDTPEARGTHPTFVEIGTNQPLFVHRAGSNAASGHYFVDHDSHDTIGHYASVRSIDVPMLRAEYEKARATPPEEAIKNSPLRAGAPRVEFPRIVSRAGVFFGRGREATPVTPAARAAQLVASLDAEGRWLTPLRSTSHPYKGEPPKEPAPGDFSRAQVGDDYDTSPYSATERVMGISTATFVSNMSSLLRTLDSQQ
jgi:PelA/Pel-15E family pectate lyase